MDENEFDDRELLWPHLPRAVPIPKIFHSLQTGGPFTHCLTCDRSLLDSDVDYAIEIVFKQQEPIIEMAVCQDCRGQLSEQISADSLTKIQQYLDGKIDFEQRARAIADRSPEDAIEPWLEECVLTNLKRSDCSEWQIYGIFQGDKLQLGYAPLMISGRAGEEMSELLSEQTRGWMNDFIGDQFGMPPEFCDSPDWQPLLL